MPMAICKFHIRSPCKWSHKQIILATLLGGLVAVTLTAGISISLAPARISFSVTNTIAGKSEDTQFYNFTLVAHNSSPRMAVLYGTLDAEIWYSPTVWVPALVDRTTALPDGRTPPDSETQMNVCAEYWQSKQVVPTTNNNNNNNQQQQQPPPVGQAPAISPPATRSTANNTDWSSCTVMVIAKVWFKAGSGISTRSYDVRASCSQVSFGRNANTTVFNCTQD